MTRERFEKLVNEGIKAIPEKFLKKLDNVDIVIEDEPTPYQKNKIKAKKNSIIFGLYEGIPQTKRTHYGEVLPDKITIFKKSIEKVASSDKEVREMVKDTVWHEIAHHFGLNEREVREAERRRKQSKSKHEAK